MSRSGLLEGWIPKDVVTQHLYRSQHSNMLCPLSAQLGQPCASCAMQSCKFRSIHPLARSALVTGAGHLADVCTTLVYSCNCNTSVGILQGSSLTALLSTHASRINPVDLCGLIRDRNNLLRHTRLARPDPPTKHHWDDRDCEAYMHGLLATGRISDSYWNYEVNQAGISST